MKETLLKELEEAYDKVEELEVKVRAAKLAENKAATEKVLQKCYKTKSGNYFKILSVEEYVAEVLVVAHDIRLDSIWLDAFESKTANFIEVTNEEFESRANKLLTELLA